MSAVVPCQSVGGAAECEEIERKYHMAKANDEASLALLAEARSMLALREAQLADCRRAMREASVILRMHAPTAIEGPVLARLADKLDAARAGKAWA